MKKLSVLFLLFTLIFCSCKKDNEPPSEINLPITYAFIPATMEIDMNDMDEAQKEQIEYLTTGHHVVNDVSELPDDPFAQNDMFKNLNYQDYTLLLVYLIRGWEFDTYSNRFYRNTVEKTYNWVVQLGMTTPPDESGEKRYLMRFAILVKKLPADATVTTWFSFSAINW